MSPSRSRGLETSLRTAKISASARPRKSSEKRTIDSFPALTSLLPLQVSILGRVVLCSGDDSLRQDLLGVILEDLEMARNLAGPMDKIVAGVKTRERERLTCLRPRVLPVTRSRYHAMSSFRPRDAFPIKILRRPNGGSSCRAACTKAGGQVPVQTPLSSTSSVPL